MRRLLIALLLSLPTLGWTAEPKIVVNGPRAAVVGGMFFLDVSDSVSDKGTPLVVGVAEPGKGAKPTVKLIKDDGVPSIVRVLPIEAGKYELVFTATGKADDKAPATTVYLVWPITVTETPTPTPDPMPTPGPTPNPTPTPNPPLPPADPVTEAGRALAKEVPLTFADSYEKAQDEVRNSDKSLEEIKKAHVDRWDKTRNEAFDRRLVPLFDQIIAPGNGKPTMEDRRRYAEAMGQIVTGIREGAK